MRRVNAGAAQKEPEKSVSGRQPWKTGRGASERQSEKTGRGAAGRQSEQSGTHVTGKQPGKSGPTDTLRVIGRALGVSMRVKKPYSLVISLAGFPAALIPAAISRYMGRFTDHVQGIYTGRGTMEAALGVMALILVLYLLQELLRIGQEYCTEADKAAVELYIQETIMDCSAAVRYQYIENEDDFQDRLSFLEQYGTYKVALSMNLVIRLAQSGLTFVTVAGSLAVIDWRILILLLATGLPAMWLSAAQNAADYKANARNMKEMRMVNKFYSIADGMIYQGRARYTIQFAGAYPWLKKRWRETADDYIAKKRRIARKFIGWNLLADLLRNGVLLVVLLLTAWKIYETPALGLGMFMSVYLLSRQLQKVTGTLFTDGAAMLGDVPYMKDFFALKDVPREPEERAPVELKQADIVYDHVSFTYPGAKTEALEDISVTIRQGEKIAVVGRNGSGKSTFINLLCGIYEPAKGQVQVGNLKVYDHLASVRNAISVAFQNFGRYETSLRNNVTVGDTSRTVEDQEILDLAAGTGADQVIAAQKDGLSEMIGSFSERGNNLSGGQWQKLALTRALIRKKSRIIILDEPTAALDPMAEARLYHRFTGLTEDKTTLLISHRLGIASVVNRILVFDKGRIVEDGSHEELMARDGVYARMYRAQAKWYQ